MRARGASGRLGAVLGLGLVVAAWGQAARADDLAEKLARGREIFNREWLPGDTRSHGGDGLGPVYNDTSCVACHNVGGPGGGGPVSKNIDILSAAPNAGGPNSIVPIDATPAQAPARPTFDVEPLAEIHAGFRQARTVVLHRFGTDPTYDAWRRRALGDGNGMPMGFPFGIQVMSQQVNFATVVAETEVVDLPATTAPVAPVVEPPLIQTVDVVAFGQNPVSSEPGEMQEVRNGITPVVPPSQRIVGAFTVTRSQRNPTPLFGIGRIDAIPEADIVALAEREARETPQTQGRVSRLKDGRVGRLGWKGQTADSEEFVLTACAVEVGLEAPGHTQALVPQAPKYQASGLDLTADECDALVAYVRSLPSPEARRPADPEEAKVLGAGRTLFADAGCANCHMPQVGDVDGLFSDLLLHDMGPELADSGSYNGTPDDDPSEPLNPPELAQNASPRARGASRQEWRTPPLWGFRDSGPYLHDGRAQTLDQAVALHGGQGAEAARRYFSLTPAERRKVEAFLKSLVAPTALARSGD